MTRKNLTGSMIITLLLCGVAPEGDLAGGDGPAALFIDRFGFGGFHGGYARMGDVRFAHVGGVGVWSYVARGARYRGAPYAVGAAAVGGAALGAAAAGAAYPYGATCGYYPYPPCYQAIMS